jgi:hypothetical protein
VAVRVESDGGEAAVWFIGSARGILFNFGSSLIGFCSILVLLFNFKVCSILVLLLKDFRFPIQMFSLPVAHVLSYFFYTRFSFLFLHILCCLYRRLCGYTFLMFSIKGFHEIRNLYLFRVVAYTCVDIGF